MFGTRDAIGRSMDKVILTAVGVALFGCTFFSASDAQAQDAPRGQAQVVVGEAPPAAPAPAPVVERRVPQYEYRTSPDPKMLRNGLWTLGVMYTTSVVVALQSSRGDDDYLYIPVAGPWLDWAHRSDSGNSKYETLYRALLITDGVIQALGAANIALSMIFPETRLVETASSGRQRTTFAFRATPLISRSVLGVHAQGAF